MKDLSILATVETPLNLPVTVSSSGGGNWGSSPMHALTQFCFYVMAARPNSSNYYIFKEDLQNLANEIGLEIRVAHYPPYTSKYNLIEHRLFPHVTRACQGAIFTSIELVKSLIEKTTTKTGLSVIVNLMDKVYAKGRQVADGFKKNLPIVFDEFLPKWNYRAIPQL